MRLLPGQAAGQAARHLWVVTHRFLTLCLTIGVLGMAMLSLLAWRLSQGPLELAWLARRIEAVVNAEGKSNVAIGGAALAWEGFRGGVDRPLDIRLREIVVTDADGASVFAVPSADISLSLLGLLLGRLEPRAIELRGPSLRAQRAADGAVTIDLGPWTEPDAPPPPVPVAEIPRGTLNALITELALPATNDMLAARDSHFSQLRRVLITGASLTMRDAQLGLIWRAPRVDIDARRHPGGGADAEADIVLSVGPEQARLHLTLLLDKAAQGGHARASLSPIAPAALANLSPAFAGLGALDATVGLEASLDLGPALAIRQGRLDAHIGPGRIVTDNGAIVFRGGEAGLTLDDAAHGRMDRLRMELQPRVDGPVSVLSLSGGVAWDGARLQGSGELSVDRISFADLPSMWPAGWAKNPRAWITQNITAGEARALSMRLALSSGADLSDMTLTDIHGGLDAEDLTVHWLRPVPPIEHINGKLTIDEPDSLEIATTGGRQVLEGPRGISSNLALAGGKLRFTGLSQRDQVLFIAASLAGPVADTIALLRHPRLRIIERSPFEVKDPAGSMTGKLAMSVPLEHNLELSDLGMRVQAHTEGLHLGAIAAGRDLDQGALDLDVTTETMKITGRAQLAGIPAQLNADLDFRSGGPGQILQRIGVSARADARVLAAQAGLNVGAFVSGPAAAQLTFSRRRDGGAELRVGAELRETELSFAPLVWRKPPGRPASLETKLRIQRDRILAVDDLAITGEDIAIRGRMEQNEGRLALLHLDRVALGRTDASGSVLFQPNGALQVRVHGGSVDLGPRLTAPPKPPGREEAGPAWNLDARFDTALLAHDVRLADFTLRADSDGLLLRQLQIAGTAGSAGISLEIASQNGARRLRARADDAASLLRGLDVMPNKLAGGTLNIEAAYDDHAADRPLVGTARMENFRVLNAPAVTGVLQAMTLYGLVQMAQGPGLGITRLIAPFRMTDTTLALNDARAFNSSLGLTVAGKIDRINESCELNGTVVPAYFFNSLLGDIPLIGKLFSPESGGGLFAANYSLRGKLSEPQVSINPLSALTPGFLRGLFGNL